MKKLTLLVEIGKILEQHKKEIQKEIIEAIFKSATISDSDSKMGYMKALGNRVAQSDAWIEMPETGEEIFFRVTVKFDSKIDNEVSEAFDEKLIRKPTEH